MQGRRDDVTHHHFSASLLGGGQSKKFVFHCGDIEIVNPLAQ